MNLNLIYKDRNPESHKGQNGVVLSISGSDEYVGAGYLTSVAALRTGVDLVHVATSEKAAFIINGMAPELITHKLKGSFLTTQHVPTLLKLAKKADSVVIGPGLGIEKETIEAVRDFLLNNTKPVVIDADAIKAIDGNLVHGSILTPHRTELTYIVGDYDESNIKDVMMKHASKDTILLLKAKTDIICDGSKCVENTTGHASMTKGGTGDVLAGITAGFLALSQDLFNSAYHAAYINGLIGEYLFKEKGFGWLTSEMLSEIPKAIKSELKSK